MTRLNTYYLTLDPSTMPEIFHIRQAAETDVDDMLRLIRELATYERCPDSVEATPDLLRKNLFKRRIANAFVAVEGTTSKPGRTVGLALYFFNFSTWTGKPGVYLEDLYVTPEYRGSGVGKALFGELGRVARENDCARVDWAVLKWNQPSIDFYEKRLGAEAMSEWMGMRLEGDKIAKLEDFIKE